MSDDLEAITETMGEAVLEAIEEHDPDGDAFEGVSVVATTTDDNNVRFDYVREDGDEDALAGAKLNEAIEVVRVGAHREVARLWEDGEADE